MCNGDDLPKFPDDTEDVDDIQECEHFDTRQSFLNLCQGNHYQFDQLRRAKHSSMMVLYHLHNPDAPKFKVTIKSNKTGEEYIANVPADRYIYFYFEEMGIDLPIVNKQRMCRQGCCTICTAKMEEGKVKMDAPLGLLKEMRAENVITCCAYPRSDLIITLQEEDEMYIRQWSEGFEGGGVEWGGVLPDDD
jgi:ferredoxin